MKAKRFLDLAAASRSLVFAWATRALVVLALLLLPMAGELIPETGPGATAYAGPPADKGSGSGDLYSDLVVTYRSIDGLPILVDVPAGIEEEEGEALAEGYVACEQPITGFPILGDLYLEDYATSAIDLSTDWPVGNPLQNMVNGRLSSPIPLGGTGVAGEECDIAYDPSTVPAYDYTMYSQEIQFGRMNVGRSPDKVLDRQLRDVIATLQSGEVGWDFAGRITVNGEAIDSPLQNLAIYRELQIFGNLESNIGQPLQLANLNWTAKDVWEYAAGALGAAAEKGEYDASGTITPDLTIYNDRILDIPNLVKQNWKIIIGNGLIGVLGERYLKYKNYSYNRYWKYRGCARGIMTNGQPFEGRIIDLVFGNDPNGGWFTASNIFAFATAADDSRRVIAFVHDTSEFIVQEIDKAGQRLVCDN